MKLLSRKSITAATAVAVLGGLSIAAVPSQAASPAHHKAPAHNATAAPTLTARQLAALPLTDRHLTKHEKTNLAIVLRDYYVAEGSHIDVPTFVNSFAKDGVFNDMVPGVAYRGKALGNVLPYMKGLFSNVHRDLKRITVNGDTISIELSIQGTFDGRLQAPTGGVVKGKGQKVDAPTADFWYLKNGKVEKFDCFVGYSKMYSDMGVNFDWASAINQH
ncbi:MULTISPECIES: nuclear transport factor 2 family protein [unclassified Streptomyces]|uniref:nuclear transport factor 2 family protein n=1 Tax=unclassified Streptomyces TaxID=2593676 RepID=UPI0019096CBC|nr:MULTISPECIES: nuclear transport factor 2 family protein [unclassified Streptomyces]MBK3571877.1 nuclear transport factor 2 family protein [Streptomyces sp. MBT62]MBK6019378.1 nuclear transport factor 2 family protein [Streptomyces sp. MBT53]